MAVDISRQTDGVNLPPELSSEIWGKVEENSTVMQVTRSMPLPGPGVTVSVITGEPIAEWTGETEKKPVRRHTLDNKTLTPYKLAVIEPFSMEFRRDMSTLYTELARRLPASLAKGFDETVYGARTAPGENFDQLDETSVSGTVDATDTIADLVGIYTQIADNEGDVSAWIARPQLVGSMMTALSQTENFDLSSSLQVGSVFGAPVYRTRSNMPEGVVGYAGDFGTDAVYGTVEGVQVSISDQATLEEDDGTTINLWQQNMFAVRAEIEVGFRTVDSDRFAQILGDVSS